jgi:hypothetical protein
MFPMDRKPVPVAVEYTSRGRRAVRRFDCAFAARRFYASKQPKVIAR